jgi:hypothetical protein
MVQNHGAVVMPQMIQQVQTLERSAASAGGMFGRLGAMVAGYVGFQQGNKHLIQYNSSMEQSRIQMAGLMAQAGSGDFVGNLDTAATLMRNMRDDAAKTVGTTQDYVQMAGQLIQPLTMAGGKVEDIREMTRLSVVASKAMGIDAVVSARDVDQAIRGVYRSVDQFTGKLLTPLGYGGEEGRKKFNALSMKQRMAEVQKAMRSPAIEAMAQAQEGTYEGVASTTESLLKQFAGSAGMPLFKGITVQLREWNTWLQANESKVEELAKQVGGALLTTVTAIKDATVFIHDNWKSMALIWASMKVPGMITAFSGGLAGGLGGGAASATAIGGLAASIGPVVAGLGLLAAAAVYAADKVNAGQGASLEMSGRYGVGVKGGTIDALIGATDRYRSAKSDAERKSNAQAMMALARNQGITNSSTMEEAAGFWSSDQRMAMARAMGQQGGWDSNRGLRQEFGFVSARDLAQAFDETRMSNVIQEWMPDRSGLNTDSGLGVYGKYNVKDTKPEKAKVNVTINRIEVASNDPDRLAFGMVAAFRDAARNPSGVGSAIRNLGG